MSDSESIAWFSEDAVSKMHALARAKFPLETGGMLLGYEAITGDPVVTDIIGPGPNAQHGRYRFTPDGEFQ